MRPLLHEDELLNSLVASSLERVPVSGVIVYVTCGMLRRSHALNMADFDIHDDGIKRLAEFALAVCVDGGE